MDKMCTKCKEVKSFKFFSKAKKTNDGYATWCRICKGIVNKQYYELNRSEVDLKRAEWRKNNPLNVKSINLKRRHGITLATYNSMLKQQHNSCAICKSLSPNRNDIDYFIVDHNHETGQIRGLLCDLCNKGIAYFKENISNLESAIVYVVIHKEKYEREC